MTLPTKSDGDSVSAAEYNEIRSLLGVDVGTPGIKVTAPTTATSSGTLGQWAEDDTYLYVCTATDTWKRVAIASW